MLAFLQAEAAMWSRSRAHDLDGRAIQRHAAVAMLPRNVSNKNRLVLHGSNVTSSFRWTVRALFTTAQIEIEMTITRDGTQWADQQTIQA